ncbi:MAG: hypothetical protein L3J25_07495, partial [Flavobacteriaceae bacterium]|nr:hypothetical protein [Flavobacteriaceae bacterium]
MKKKHLLFYSLFISFIFSCSNSNDINLSPPFEGDVFLKNQQEVNEFGANNHSGINGNLTIGYQNGLRDISNLGPLSSLTYVNGNVEIDFNDYLITLNGLNNMQEINGYLNIGSNDRLENLSGLGSLNSVNNIQIAYNYSLTQINDLNNISSLNGGFAIFRCDNLENINGLENITEIGGTLNLSNIPIEN